MNKLSERQIGYLAAMIDGEGMIGLGRKKSKNGETYGYNPYVRVTNTNKTVLIWCRDTTSLGYVTYAAHEGKPNRKDCYEWRLRIGEMIEFLKVIQPALIIKWEQAEYLLDYLKLEKFNRYNRITEDAAFQRQLLYEMLKDLNKRGL